MAERSKLGSLNSLIVIHSSVNTMSTEIVLVLNEYIAQCGEKYFELKEMNTTSAGEKIDLSKLTQAELDAWVCQEDISEREFHKRLMECYSYTHGSNPLLLTGKTGVIYLPPQQMCCIQPLEGGCNCSGESVVKLELEEVIQMSFCISAVKVAIAKDEFATFELKTNQLPIECKIIDPSSNEKVDVTTEVSYFAAEDIYWNEDPGSLNWTLQLTCQYKHETHVVEPIFELEVVS